MTFDAMEKSTAGSKPFELFLFQGTTINMAVTSGDLEISYVAQTFVPTTISRDEIDVSNEVTSGQMKVYVPKDHPIAQLFVAYLPTSQVALTVFAGHDGDPDIFVVFSGYVASATFGDQATLICNAFQYKMQTRIPRILYQAPCPHVFGDQFCGVDLSTVTYAGVVGAISADGTEITVTAFGALPHSLIGGYFRRGNDLRMITAQAGDVITLITPIAGLAINDVCLGTAGCQGTFSDCNSFLNIANFLGFDLIPILNPFDGSIT
jgi:Phage conserved hypothetical protein BR0599